MPLRRAATPRLRIAFSRTSLTGDPIHPECMAAVEDAAHLLGGASGQHVRNLIQAGALPARDIRSPGASRPTYRIRRVDALAYEAQQLEHALAPTTYPASGPRLIIQTVQTTQTTR